MTIPDDNKALVRHTRICGGYDNRVVRLGALGPLIWSVMQTAEHTPLNVLGRSHFLVVEKQ
jgi:hypothetical protein